jgi:hypothetical protein
MGSITVTVMTSIAVLYDSGSRQRLICGATLVGYSGQVSENTIIVQTLYKSCCDSITGITVSMLAES